MADAKSSGAGEGSSSGGAVISIPQVEFVDDVDNFMALKDNENNAQAVLKRLEEVYSRLKLIEQTNVRTKARLRDQLSEFDKSLKMIKHLRKRREENKDTITQFRLADHAFITAKVPPVDNIGLWLGANVMLEYGLDEGEALLKEKQQKAENSLKATNDLIDDVRENVTTLEVNMARIYNWDVKRRQAEKEKALASK
uniref:Prefoldin subunit 3 n=1 Tax=Isotomurus palustris TaxID=36144 RepID=A0A481SVR5_9HEXA|nr:prefoldin subunit [Isotomurus palustris]